MDYICYLKKLNFIEKRNEHKMSSVLLFSPLIIFLVLLLLIKCFMTEKRNFTFRDKIIFTMGGFFVLLIIGGIKNEIFFILISFSFFFHVIILILPMYTELWKNYFHMIGR